MSVLKNKRRTSKIEYEKNFLGFYEYMMNLIDHMPKRWSKPLGAPMKEALNQMYDVMYGGYRLTRRYWKQNTRLHRKRKVVRI